MEKKDYKNAIARRSEIRSEMRELQGKLAKENRAMSDDERKHFDTLRAEDDQLQIDCTQYEIERSTERAKRMEKRNAEVSGEVNFTRFLRSVAAGKPIPSDLQALRNAEGKIVIPFNRAEEQLRAESIQQAGSVTSITPIYIQDYIRELEPATVIGQLGCRIQSGIQGQWNFPTVKGVEPKWYGENEAVTGDVYEFGVKTIGAHRLPVRVDISNRAINQTGGAVRSIVLETMRNKHALALNKAFVSNTAITNAPTGPFLNIGAEQTIAATGALGTLKRDDFINLRSKVNGKSNVPVNNPAYLINWDTWAQLVNTPIDKGSGRFILDPQSGTIDGIKVIMSNLVPDGAVYYGNFGYALVGQFGQMTIGIDSSSVSVLSTNTISIVINSEWDFFTPYQEAFGKITYTTSE